MIPKFNHTIICFAIENGHASATNCWTGVYLRRDDKVGIFRAEQGVNGHWFAGRGFESFQEIIEEYSWWKFVILDYSGNCHEITLKDPIKNRVVRD